MARLEAVRDVNLTRPPRPDEAADWELDPWDGADGAPSVERLRGQSRVGRWVVWSMFVICIALVLIAGFIGWWYIGQINPSGEPGAPISFTVTEDDDLHSISERLETDGFIVNAGVFRDYVERKGGLEITPGYYEIAPGDHVGNILGRLRTPPSQTYSKITFPEGFTVAQMSERLGTNVDRMSAEQFLAAATGDDVTANFLPPGVTTLEGLLFPDTYQVSNSENEAQVVERMVGLMERVASQEDLVAGAEELGRTPYDILIIASMIEREAKVDEDRAKISAVIHNRLFIGMPLQIDATVRYGQDPDVPFSQLRQIDGPYNTYLRTGLPPTPIANPGRASIRAALNPIAQPLPPGDPLCQELPDPTQGCNLFYYVLADEDGRHAFAVTGEQHQRNVDAAAAAGLLE